MLHLLSDCHDRLSILNKILADRYPAVAPLDMNLAMAKAFGLPSTADMNRILGTGIEATYVFDPDRLLTHLEEADYDIYPTRFECEWLEKTADLVLSKRRVKDAYRYKETATGRYMVYHPAHVCEIYFANWESPTGLESVLSSGRAKVFIDSFKEIIDCCVESKDLFPDMAEATLSNRHQQIALVLDHLLKRCSTNTLRFMTAIDSEWDRQELFYSDDNKWLTTLLPSG